MTKKNKICYKAAMLSKTIIGMLWLCGLNLWLPEESHAGIHPGYWQQQDTIKPDTAKKDTAIKPDTAQQDTAKAVNRGKVTDSKGEPLPGVTIAIKGTTKKVQTDSNGVFALLKSENPASILVFSGVGFKQIELPLSVALEKTITLEDEENKLKEVVVIGYGTVKKDNLTGAVSSLQGSAFQTKAITNSEDGIAGKIPGVRVSQTSGRPGEATNIKIRGVNSITASSSPLYVIDGIPQDNMRNLNPRDISSMEVLKDASSAAIYGARGGNGVVVITTKTGAEGSTKVDVNSYAGFQEVDKLLPMMNTDEYTKYIMFVRNERFRQTGGDLTAPVSSRPSDFQYPDSYMNPSTLPDNNWQEIIYHNAPMQNYSMNVSGGGKIGNYLLSGSYLDQDGVMQYTGYKRYNARANTNFNLGEKVKVGANLATSFINVSDPVTEGKESNTHYAIVMPPVVEIDQNTEATGYSQAQTFINPLVRLREMTAKSKSSEIQVNSYAEYKPISTLTLRTQLGYISSHATYNEFIPTNVNKGVPATGQASSTDDYTFNIQNTANYIPDLGEDHYLDILVGQGYEKLREDVLRAAGDGFPNDLLPSLNNATHPTLASTTVGESATASFFGRVQYQFMDRYLLSASARYDGSSRFGPNNRWGLFPAVSVGWKMNEESFLKDVDWISLLKIRGSIGKAGNDRIGNYEQVALLGILNYNLGGKLVNGLVPANIANPDLGWESTVSKDIGLDATFLGERLQFSADVYLNNTHDLLLNVPLSYLNGVSNVRQNVGEVENKGLELSLTSQNIQNETISWTTSVNFSKNKNKVLKMGNDNAPIVNQSWAGQDAYITKVGYPIGSFYMYETDGLLMPADFDADGNALVPIASQQQAGNVKIVDKDGNGVINTNDETVVGNSQPDFIWGLSNTLKFKGFDFSFDIQGQQGGEIFYEGKRNFDNGVGDGTNQYKNWLHSYKTPEAMASIPAGADMAWDGKTPNFFGFNPINNDTWVFDASFVRIRNITLGYNFATSMLKKLNISNLRVYIMGDNVHTFTHYRGSNPEASNMNTDPNSAAENTEPATDYGGYPISRRFSIGVNVTF